MVEQRKAANDNREKEGGINRGNELLGDKFDFPIGAVDEFVEINENVIIFFEIVAAEMFKFHVH